LIYQEQRGFLLFLMRNQGLWSGFSGLERTVTFYDCNGKVIKSWTGDLNVEDQGGTIRFVANGKAIIVGGNFVVEEK
ncbi:MAG: hypothetical protein ACP5VS_17330, partial [Desulfomonilaceae bacterium]